MRHETRDMIHETETGDIRRERQDDPNKHKQNYPIQGKHCSLDNIQLNLPCPKANRDLNWQVFIGAPAKLNLDCVTKAETSLTEYHSLLLDEGLARGLLSGTPCLSLRPQ